MRSSLAGAPYKEGKPSDDAWVLRDLIHYGFVNWDESMGNDRRDRTFIDDERPMEFDEKTP